MGAPTDVYVDPSIDADSGTSTSGDPYGDFQYALDSHSRDTTNGNRLKYKAGTDEVLTATLDFSTFGWTEWNAPMIIAGYTSTVGDGGIGSIDCGGNSGINQSSHDGLLLENMKFHNAGAYCVRSDDYTVAVGCEFSGASTANLVLSSGGVVIGSHFHDGSGVGVQLNGFSHVFGNYFKNGSTNKFSVAIDCVPNSPRYSVIERNIVSVDSTTIGIDLDDFFCNVINNSLYSTGTGDGINVTGHSEYRILNNLVEGFNVGIEVKPGGSAEDSQIIMHNALYDNTTNYDHGGVFITGDNETLTASPFDKSGSDTFANRATYFGPVDTGNVRAGAFPTALRLDKGAVQHADGVNGGSTSVFFPGSSGQIGVRES